MNPAQSGNSGMSRLGVLALGVVVIGAAAWALAANKPRSETSPREQGVIAIPAAATGAETTTAATAATAAAATATATAAPAATAATAAPSATAPTGTPAASGHGLSSASGHGSARADFVGAKACSECHGKEMEAWTGSHHDLAMQPADESTVLGDFNGATFEHFGVTSTFSRHDGKFFVRTDGADGKLADFEIKYTFGVFPLQQYLIEFSGGRLQALGIAWDARPAADGGQRWYHLYPAEPVDHTDQLHWTGRYQNWNLMCAECHSTDLRKGYDAATNSYATTYSEIDVSCEACHGPGRQHAEWARTAKPPYAAGADNGLDVHFASDWAGSWIFPSPDAKFPERQSPLDPALNNSCAACHARRSTLVEGATPGAPLEDSHRLALLTAPNYHVDGQQRDEVYTWGSFLQSRMYAQGVSCVDCHDPHTLKTRLPGNQLCQRCHVPERFDTKAHHFHEPGSTGASCVACHMPTQKYMVVHDRLDHSLRVPRPDLSTPLGSPDACTMCHADKQPSWAAAAMDGWYGPTWRSRPQWGPLLHAGAVGVVGSLPALLELAGDAGTSTRPAAPGIVRATAASLAQSQLVADALPAVVGLLQDDDPLVRIEGLALLEPFSASIRAQVAGLVLTDPVLGVRIEAARLIADVPDAQLKPADQVARKRALDELLATYVLNADWPAENVNRGNLALKQGRTGEAVTAFQRAIELDSRFIGAYVNLADALRQLGREDEGEAALRRGLEISPRAADLHHALGLLLVRRQDTEAALTELGRAADLATDNPRYAYVYAIGLHSAGKVPEALEVLRAADARNPHDPDILGTLVSILRERGGPGDAAAALGWARKLQELMPGNEELEKIVAELQQAQ